MKGTVAIMVEFSFLVPLGIGLVVGYKSLGSNHDIAHLVAVFAVINLLVSLLLAPWEIQILLLGVVAIAVRLLWVKFDNQTDYVSSATLQENQGSALQYRGISYQSPGATESLEQPEQTAKCYRGINYQSPKPCPQPPQGIPKKIIKYRGTEVHPQ
ncbi:MAG: DUF4278 domain-containing protein [Synechocystis sp.]|nr:DUF4278 domain-containing protein [Synechocystis sp.]